MSLEHSAAMSGIAVQDLAAAREFYTGLGVRVEGGDDGPLARLILADGREVIVYEQPTCTPASFTILNFPVPDVDAAVRALTDQGVVFERYEGMPQDEYGVMHGNGPDIAWFTDPSGNTLSILAEG